MTHPRGRAGHGSAPRALRAACVLLTVAAAAGACARPGDTPAGAPRDTTISAVPVTPEFGPVPAPATQVSRRPGEAGCARVPEPIEKPIPSGSGVHVRATLTGAGLAGVTVRPGPSFAASTGEVCILGTFTGETPAFTIGALAADRSCPL